MDALKRDFLNLAFKSPLDVDLNTLSSILKYIDEETIREFLNRYGDTSPAAGALKIVMRYPLITSAESPLNSSVRKLFNKLIRLGYSSSVRVMIKAGIDVNMTYPLVDGKRYLQIAIEDGTTTIIEELLNAGADQTFNNCAPLMHCAKLGYSSSVRVLMEKLNLDPIYPDFMKKVYSLFDVIGVAIEHNNREIVSMIVNDPRIADFRCAKSTCLLGKACKGKNTLIIIETLLSSNLIEPACIQISINWAIENDNEYILAKLVHAKQARWHSLIKCDDYQLLRYAIKSGMVKLTEELIDYSDGRTEEKIDILNAEEPCKNKEQFIELRNRLRPQTGDKITALEAECAELRNKLKAIRDIVNNVNN